MVEVLFDDGGDFGGRAVARVTFTSGGVILKLENGSTRMIEFGK